MKASKLKSHSVVYLLKEWFVTKLIKMKRTNGYIQMKLKKILMEI